MCDKDDKKNYYIIESLLVISLGLGGWTLKTTTETQQLLSNHEIRLSHLERENLKNDRFTKGDGDLLRKDLQHAQSMILQHIEEANPVLRDLRDWMIVEKSNGKLHR